MHIVILDDYADSVTTLRAFERIRHHNVKIYCEPVREPKQWAERLAQAQVLIPIRERSTIDQSVLEQAPRLRMVSCAGTAPGNLDLAYCSHRKIAVAQSRGSGHATAELCWALVLAAQRRLIEQIATLRAGKWQGPLGRQLYGRRLGLGDSVAWHNKSQTTARHSVCRYGCGGVPARLNARSKPAGKQLARASLSSPNQTF